MIETDVEGAYSRIKMLSFHHECPHCHQKNVKHTGQL